MPTTPDIPGVPDQYQWIIYLTGLIAAVYSGLRALSAGRREAERMRPEADVIVQGGSFVDMRPIKEMNTNLEHLVNHTAAFAIAQRQTADTLEQIRQLMKSEASQDDAARLMDLAVRNAILEQRLKDTLK